VSLLDDITAHGAQIRDRLWDLLERHAYPDDTKSVWVAGSIAVALEHHEAISLLAQRQLTGSAFALVRPQSVGFLACLRGSPRYRWICNPLGDGKGPPRTDEPLEPRIFANYDEWQKLFRPRKSAQGGPSFLVQRRG
jgi:hypothetical protein